jgi:hypothetical protein
MRVWATVSASSMPAEVEVLPQLRIQQGGQGGFGVAGVVGECLVEHGLGVVIAVDHLQCHDLAPDNGKESRP